VERVQLNHVMIYSKDVPRAVRFYTGLGMAVVGTAPGYARLRCPGTDSTIALHKAEDGIEVGAEGIRLYFEVEDLDATCERLAAEGVVFKQMPKDMPWGWRHAYCDDPDGHELSLYWAGEKRLRA
jgi:catechol 2,3-dioxygenase-like lactoylglutathione lyase family enzyme